MTRITFDPSTLGGDVAAVRELKREATQRLLGDTISIDDADWQLPSRLPGWTRAHVATHVARNADGFRRSIESLVAGQPERMYDSDIDKERDIERGSERKALDLQIDLDTSSGKLHSAFDQLAELDPMTTIELRSGFRLPVRLVPLARLNEVVLHHCDLDVGYSPDQIDEAMARPLLEWTAYRLGDREDIPHLHIRGESGVVAEVGGYGPIVEISGNDNDLLGWLTGRCLGENITGNDDLIMPLWG